MFLLKLILNFTYSLILALIALSQAHYQQSVAVHSLDCTLEYYNTTSLLRLLYILSDCHNQLLHNLFLNFAGNVGREIGLNKLGFGF